MASTAECTCVNFERPGWKQLVADIDAGLVGVVIAKDLIRVDATIPLIGTLLLRFYDADMQFVSECGDFKAWIGHDSMTDNGTDFQLLD